MKSLFTIFSEQVAGLWSQVRDSAQEGGFLPLLRPVPPYDGSPLLSPAAMVATLLGLIALSGIALGAIAALTIALLGLYLLLTEVLGLSIELRPLGA